MTVRLVMRLWIGSEGKTMDSWSLRGSQSTPKVLQSALPIKVGSELFTENKVGSEDAHLCNGNPASNKVASKASFKSRASRIVWAPPGNHLCRIGCV